MTGTVTNIYVCPGWTFSKSESARGLPAGEIRFRAAKAMTVGLSVFSLLVHFVGSPELLDFLQHKVAGFQTHHGVYENWCFVAWPHNTLWRLPHVDPSVQNLFQVPLLFSVSFPKCFPLRFWSRGIVFSGSHIFCVFPSFAFLN